MKGEWKKSGKIVEIKGRINGLFDMGKGRGVMCINGLNERGRKVKG